MFHSKDEVHDNVCGLTDITIQRENVIKSRLQNELHILRSHQTELTEEEIQLTKQLNEDLRDEHLHPSSLYKSRIMRLDEELQNINSLKHDIEENLNDIEYKLSVLKMQKRANENFKEFVDRRCKTTVKVRSKSSTKQTQKKKQIHGDIIYKNLPKTELSPDLPCNKKLSKQPTKTDKILIRMKSAVALKASIEDSKIIMAIVQAKQSANRKSLLLEEKALSIQAEQNLKDEKLELALHRRLASIKAHQAAFEESQNRRYKEIIAKLLREEFLHKQKMRRFPSIPKQGVNYEYFKYLENSEQPSKLEQRMIDEILEHKKKDETMVNSLMNSATIDEEQNDDINDATDKTFPQSYESLSGLVDSFTNYQKIVTKDNVDQAVYGFVNRDVIKPSPHQSNRETFSTKPDLQKLTNTSSPKMSDIDNLNCHKEDEHTKRNIYFSERSSKADKEILQRVLQQTRENIVQPQIVTGRKFEGPSFTAKPAEIWFKNFEVGRTHKISVTLTNASYAISTCRYVGITSTLMDFVSVKFTPPGMLSPGMNCGLKIKFTPKMNKNLTGEIEFLSPTGPFFIPFKATVKKCEFSIDCSVVDFGEVIIGKTVSRSIKLTNSGAKGANFTFKALSEISDGKGSENITEALQETSDHVECVNESTICNQTKKNEKNNSNDHHEIESECVTEEYQQINIEKCHSHLNDISSNFYSGELKSGYLAPFSSVKLEIIWSPNESSINVDEYIKEEEKFIIRFDDPESSDICIHSIGSPKNVPVWLSTTNLSMGICWYDRLYQECFAVHNRTKSALKVVFEVDKNISDHLKILPKTGFVQAESRLLAQIKLFPKLSLSDDLANFLCSHNNHSNKNSDSGKREDVSSLLLLSYDPQTGVLQVPVTVHVVDQTNTLVLMVDAIITTTDLTLSPNPIDFGYAEIHETVVTRLSITNHSLLPQNFGIIELPSFIDIQPNDGFGVILGKETIELELLFQPKKAKEYHFTLVCKSGIGRTFTIECRGVGVYSPLSLSSYQLNFNPTPINESNTTNLKICNHHTSSNPFTHVQPCIGSDTKVVPVGPRAFELQIVKASVTNAYGLVADNDISNDLLESVLSSFISFYPATGTLKPGESQQIRIRFSPCLNKQCIQREASRLCDINKEKQKNEKSLSNEENKTGKPSKVHESVIKAGQSTFGKKEKIIDKKVLKAPNEKSTSETETFFLPTDPNSILEDSEEYIQGFNSLLTYYPSHPPAFTINQDELHITEPELSMIKLDEYTWPGVYVVYRVACFVADGPGSDTAAKPFPSYKKENTLFFEMICPIIRPAILIESHKSFNLLDFGAICAGQRNTRILTIKNISSYSLQLKSKPLNPVGAFEIIQFKEIINSGEICCLSFAFTPNSQQSYCMETFRLQVYPIDNKIIKHSNDEFCSLRVKFVGICVTPIVELVGPPELTTIPSTLQKIEQHNVPSNLKQSIHYLNFGYVLPGEFTERQITLYNPTNISLDFQIMIDVDQISGSCNQNGLPVFMILPNQGKIKSGDKQVISITFSPDHESDTYQQTYLITLHSQIHNSHKLVLNGACIQHNLYIRGGDRLENTSDILGLSVQNDFLGEQLLPETKESKTTSYLTITGQQSSLAREDSNANSEIEPIEKEDTDNLLSKKEIKHNETSAKRILYAGYVNSPNRNAKKSGECTVENLNELSLLGFTVSPPKLILEPGNEQPIVFTWTPNPDVKTGTVVKSTAIIQLRSDVTTYHRIILRGIL
ncbi:Cilia- and flagella-associated protein [Schistosoma japonicum]|nr:Cilia- and flagella-associated protein [Schistosoma japonicum]